MPRKITPSINTLVRRLFSPPRTGQVTLGTRDIDPRLTQLFNIKFVFFSFVCSRCQVGYKGNRAMGACITNKFMFWHTLLPQVNLCFVFNVLGCVVSPTTGSRDIDPGSNRANQGKFYIRNFLEHGILAHASKIPPISNNEFLRHTMPPPPRILTNSLRSKKSPDIDTLASDLTIKGKIQH